MNTNRSRGQSTQGFDYKQVGRTGLTGKNLYDIFYGSGGGGPDYQSTFGEKQYEVQTPGGSLSPQEWEILKRGRPTSDNAGGINAGISDDYYNQILQRSQMPSSTTMTIPGASASDVAQYRMAQLASRNPLESAMGTRYQDAVLDPTGVENTRAQDALIDRLQSLTGARSAMHGRGMPTQTELIAAIAPTVAGVQQQNIENLRGGTQMAQEQQRQAVALIDALLARIEDQIVSGSTGQSRDSSFGFGFLS